MIDRGWRPASLVLVTVFLVAVFLVALRVEGQAPSASAAQSMEWSPCGSGFECATLSVPLDYGQPAGRQIEVALVRQPARDPEARIGSLLANPGGPGASGIDFVRSWARSLDGEVQDRFNIVGFDPRGVGQSTPLHCNDDIQRLVALDPEPDNADEWAETRRVTQAFADLCEERGGELLPHLGSLDVVRDMERIREALGDEQLTYVGYSYGTVLGALYADRFPDRVRALVLDGPVDFSLSADELTRTQALGFEAALDHFLEDCRATDCVLEADGRDPAATLDELLAAVEAAPIPSTSADRAAGPGETTIGIASALYREQSWPGLAEAIAQALDGDGSRLVRLADRLLGREGDGYDNSFEMNSAVNCLDYAYARDPAHYEALARSLDAQAPRFGAAFAASGMTCALWPVPPDPIALLDRVEDAPPLLVIGTTGDPATPYEWALAMRRQLGSSLLLTHEGDGHTVYASGNRCADNVVGAYLLTLTVPEDGAICGTDAEPRSPATPPVLAATAIASATPTMSGRMPAELPPAGRQTADGTYWWVWAVVAAAVMFPLLGGAWFVIAVRRRRAHRT